MNIERVARELDVVIVKWSHVLQNNEDVNARAEHLMALTDRLITGSYKNEAQANRWIGYIQGCLVSCGEVTVEEMMVLNKRG